MNNKQNIQLLLAEAESLIESIKYIYEIDSRDQNKSSSFSSHLTFAQRQADLAAKIRIIFPTANFYVYDTSKMRGTFDSVYMSRRNIFDSVLVELGRMKSFLLNQLGTDFEEVENVTSLIKSKLRSATHEKPTIEKEVQNNIENLLIARNYSRGIDYDRETGRVKTGVKESVPDFIFERLNFCIEVKLVTEKTDLKKIVEQINADIQAYGKKYKSVLFVIYDAVGKVQNEEEFKSNIEEKGRILMEIIKH